ncbi:hypothetical protein BWD09_07005 [Neisseria dentiae]|uniref:Uncharacterized protein n=1 Tax=Neisseria dentiae TaxID=194197 RepID=A0A1X3DAF3_9NEIS|nr:hypothetical protein [Neisseria dentiae]OSI16507.1 hypothetical protein BWD09_07005 [Neisseria dentiae]QMT44233.1 hypothetical protein H3L92_06970 [Neisseria dentiae]STZ49906.1 Uncharacterised protein [Neisseria dentiae]STZ83158.1 Uncharacterised protein [Neisseria dentiae]
MPAITFDRFDGGLDLRQLQSSADANRLRTLRNAYITTGRTIKKRPGMKKVANMPTNTVGIFSGIDGLFTFTSDVNSPKTAQGIDGSLIRIIAVPYNNDTLQEIVHVEVFNGNLYVAAKYVGGDVKHHYISGDDPKAYLIDDANCPHSRSFIKKSGKMFAIKDDVVRFSATGNARDWTTEKDAGFLPVSLQQSVNNKPTALGEYQDNLVVFFEDTAQIWQVDANPANHRLVTTVPIGTVYQYSHANMSNDIFFLSPSGFRSIAVQAFSTNMMDNDIGSPIDTIVKDTITSIANNNPRMMYFRGGGQIICFSGNIAYVYCFSRSSKISAWCKWEFPLSIDNATEMDSKVYLRCGNNLFVLDEKTKTDFDTYGIDAEIELPFLDMRQPGILKQFTGVDIAAYGDIEMSFKFDARNPELETMPLYLDNDTRSMPRIPVEVMATNMAINIKNNSDGDFELAAITVYFERMSGFGV